MRNSYSEKQSIFASSGSQPLTKEQQDCQREQFMQLAEIAVAEYLRRVKNGKEEK